MLVSKPTCRLPTNMAYQIFYVSWHKTDMGNKIYSMWKINCL